MLHVSDGALDFALNHIVAKGDTDILPPAHEFGAILHHWDEVKPELARRDLDAWVVRPARRCLSPKRGLGFRIATQLDPLDTLLITAIGYEIGADLESRRVAVQDDTVYSYRFAPTPAGQLYRPDVNFDSFRARSLELAALLGGLVVVTDIADFFPRIYHHPLENALRVSTSSQDHARVITKLTSAWNQGMSHGIPVGPAIFRLFAEITIDDVDRALLSDGYTFCRYSDDYRIFVPDERSAREALAFLANTLLRHHGLTIQESKTAVIPASKFIERFEKTEVDQERQALKDRFEVLRIQLLDEQERRIDELVERGEFDPWKVHWAVGLDGYTDIAYEDLNPTQRAIVDSLNLWQLIRDQVEGSGTLDVPLTRFALRRIAELKVCGDYKVLLNQLRRLYPVFPQVVMALAAQGEGDDDLKLEIGEQLLALFDDPIVGHLEYHRNWILSVFTTDSAFNHSKQLVQIYNSNADQLTRPEVVAALGVAGLAHWFRSRKQDVTALPPWERRAFLAGAACLPKDEAKHWFRSITPQLDLLERVVAKGAMAAL